MRTEVAASSLGEVEVGVDVGAELGRREVAELQKTVSGWWGRGQ